MGLVRVGELEIGEDFRFQQREWTIQRISWVVMLLIIIAAFAGVFGHGPVANATTGDDEALQLLYPRIDRKLSPTSMELTVAPNTAQNGQVEIWVATSYLDRFNVASISPEPSEMRAGSDRVVYVFEVNDPAQPAEITFHGQFHEWGRVRARLGLMGGSELSVRQFIYP